MEINSIEWHEENLKNWKIHHQSKRVQSQNLKKEVLREEDKIDFYDFQVREARINNKKSFDRDKYRVSKKQKDALSEKKVQEINK